MPNPRRDPLVPPITSQDIVHTDWDMHSGVGTLVSDEDNDDAILFRIRGQVLPREVVTSALRGSSDDALVRFNHLHNLVHIVPSTNPARANVFNTTFRTLRYLQRRGTSPMYSFLTMPTRRPRISLLMLPQGERDNSFIAYNSNGRRIPPRRIARDIRYRDVVADFTVHRALDQNDVPFAFGVVHEIRVVA